MNIFGSRATAYITMHNVKIGVSLKLCLLDPLGAKNKLGTCPLAPPLIRLVNSKAY